MAQSQNMQTKYSTTKLGEHLHIDTKALFQLLAEHGYIERIENKWQLTAHGEFVGGSYQQSDKFGRFIVWPHSFAEHDLFKRYVPEFISATKIAERFELSPHLVNLLFADLGLIKREEGKGWLVSQAGITLGGQQRNAKQANNAFYAMWPGNLLEHGAIGEALKSMKGATGSLSLDGRMLPTLAEQYIANYLYLHRMPFACDKTIDALAVAEHSYRCSFYLPKQHVYIDYFGLENMHHALSDQLKKHEFIKQQGLSLVEISDEDLHQLDSVLPQKLLSLGIDLNHEY